MYQWFMIVKQEINYIDASSHYDAAVWCIKSYLNNSQVIYQVVIDMFEI